MSHIMDVLRSLMLAVEADVFMFIVSPSCKISGEFLKNTDLIKLYSPSLYICDFVRCVMCYHCNSQQDFENHGC
jgi:hypothetical protein